MTMSIRKTKKKKIVRQKTRKNHCIRDNHKIIKTLVNKIGENPILNIELFDIIIAMNSRYCNVDINSRITNTIIKFGILKKLLSRLNHSKDINERLNTIKVIQTIAFTRDMYRYKISKSPLVSSLQHIIINSDYFSEKEAAIECMFVIVGPYNKNDCHHLKKTLSDNHLFLKTLMSTLEKSHFPLGTVGLLNSLSTNQIIIKRLLGLRIKPLLLKVIDGFQQTNAIDNKQQKLEYNSYQLLGKIIRPLTI